MDFIVGLLAIAMLGGVGYFIYTRITRERPKSKVPMPPMDAEMLARLNDVMDRMSAKDRLDFEMPTVHRPSMPDETKD